MLVITTNAKAIIITSRIIFISFVMGFDRKSDTHLSVYLSHGCLNPQPISGSFLRKLLHFAPLAGSKTPPSHASTTVSQPVGLKLSLLTGCFLYTLRSCEAKWISWMSRPNVMTCPRCSARAHRILPNWWQRLWLGRLSAYFCASCKYRFNR